MPTISEELEEVEPFKRPDLMKCIASGLDIKESRIPVDLLFNPVIDKYKQAEFQNELNPTPLTFIILKDKATSYRLVNEERGIKLDVPSEVLNNETQVKKTGNVLWLQKTHRPKVTSKLFF